ncbi:chromosome partitioning protein [Pseudomonas sp. NZIPFR-PS5]|nr:chromosome partitioning protein [Pseudomonas sp. NZIPFR-PS5]
MGSVKSAFERDVLAIPLEQIFSARGVGTRTEASKKYLSILASVRELGVIEPIAVHRETADEKGPRYLLLDGRMRLRALQSLGATHALCLVASDDEGFTYNRQVNRLTPIQEHKMILLAIKKGTSAVRIAQALNVNVEHIRRRQQLLEGVAPEVVEMLKDRQVNQHAFGAFKKMKPMRQIETAEMMLSANCFTNIYAKMMLAATRPDQLATPARPRKPRTTFEDINRLEREMEKVSQDYRLVEDTMGETMLVLVVAKGYVSRLLRNEAIAEFLQLNYEDLVKELACVMDAMTADGRGDARE